MKSVVCKHVLTYTTTLSTAFKTIKYRTMSIRLFDEKQHASVYAKYRPAFPSTVYSTIFNYCKENSCNFELAVDIGCGSGQSSIPLTKTFKKVIGYDVSEQQIAFAPKDISNLTFRVGPGEDLSFWENEEVDLITVAQALHWMDLEKFYNEVRRVVKPGGVFVAYGYGNNIVDEENAQLSVNVFYKDLLGPYWDNQRKHIDDHYQNMSHPFKDWRRIETDDISIRHEMPVDAFIGYLSSWSAWRTYLKQHPQSDILDKLKNDIEMIYNGRNISVTWPVFMLIGRKEI